MTRGSHYRQRRRRGGRRLLTGTMVVAGIVVLALVAIGVDTVRASGQVPRNVSIDGSEVSGRSGPELWQAVHQVGSRWGSVPVTVTTPKGQLETTLGALGVRVDERQLAIDAWNARSTGLLGLPATWFRSFLDPRNLSPSFTVDPAAATDALAGLEAQVRVEPTEPDLTAGDTKVEVAPGRPGETIDPRAVADDARAEAERMAAGPAGTGDAPGTITVAAHLVPLPPRTTDTEVQVLADQANQLTDRRLAIYLGTKSGVVDTRILRSWLEASRGPEGLVLTANPERVAADVNRILGTVGTPMVDTGFTVGADGAVSIVDGHAGQKCCTPESIDRITSALRQDQGRVDLELATVNPTHDRAWAERLGVATPVATFTTNHPCCQPRVTNIHRFADLIRGQVIEPGQTLSLNAAVGQRTEERGFVKAPVIYDSKYDEDVGGGVSQFAVTMFNAAFFAGLDIPAYQMHSIYIDRYPYGREATISWDQPDLKVHNNTPYGVLVWPTYTDTSITVTLYSTPWIKGDQTNQTQEPKGSCTRVTTERTRTLLGDNSTSTDTFVALYQPSEGVKCG